ncbi:MAG: metallophosphoesterase [Oligoflexia bacterium]|nr:metallophosphoesterase [Oligoflexia bacterium]
MNPQAEAPRRPCYRLVVSDFHLGKGRYLPDGTQNILEDFIYDREFSEFLAYYRTGEFADADVELVFNGDILNLLQIDTWGVHTHMVTERAMVQAVKRIVAGHPEFFQALRRFAATPGHTVSYVVGNHDMGMLWLGPRKVFESAVGAPVIWNDVFYLKDGIYIEHGQQYEVFSATDMQKPFITRGLPEPVLNLPWASLFVAIVLPWVKQQRPHVDKVRPFHYFIRWVAINDLWWGVKIGLYILKFMFDTVLFQRRYQIQKNVKQTMSMLKQITIYPNFDKIAFRILEERDDVNVVIFGHTHLLRYRRWREGKEYFNEGTWNDNTNLELDDYGKSIRLTYAFIEYPAVQASAPRPTVRLKQWFGVSRPEADMII